MSSSMLNLLVLVIKLKALRDSWPDLIKRVNGVRVCRFDETDALSVQYIKLKRLWPQPDRVEESGATTYPCRCKEVYRQR